MGESKKKSLLWGRYGYLLDLHINKHILLISTYSKTKIKLVYFLDVFYCILFCIPIVNQNNAGKDLIWFHIKSPYVNPPKQCILLLITEHYLLGCGTGKYLGLAPESFILGSDSCLKLGEIAAKRGHNVVACDNQNLPFRDNCFDAVISVGVIHHFASARRRIKALEELYRILQPGGKMLVYVWALEQDERKVCEKFINLNGILTFSLFFM